MHRFFLTTLFFLSSFFAMKGLAQTKDTASVLHPRNGLPHFFEKLHGSDSVVIAYLGGSITAAAGYRVQTEELIRNQYPKCKIRTVKAAVGGTGSPLGVFRVDNEVLKYKPDLVFVEFAVNDASTDSLRVCKSMEGIVRKIKMQDLKTDICFLYTISQPMLKAFEQNRLASSVRYMERVAAHYGIPSINLGFDIYGLLMQNKLVFRGEKGSVSVEKILFTYDGTHPTVEGHRIYTKTIMSCFEWLKTVNPSVYRLPAALVKNNYQAATAYSPLKFKTSGTWKAIGSMPELARFSSDLPDLIYTNQPADSLILRFKGTFFGIEDIIGPSSSSMSITVDGKDHMDKLRFDKSSTYYRRSYFYIDSLKDVEHMVVIKPSVNNDGKLKILKDIHKETDRKYFSNAIYIGHILLNNLPAIDGK